MVVLLREVLILNFFSMGNLGTYTKNLGMQMKWQQKKDNNDFSADGSTNIADPIRKQAEDIRRANADGTTKMNSQIDLKLKCGQRLTAEEMEYLQKTDPQKYQKIKAMQAEQESYEKELKRCKTKEEVQRVRMAHTAGSLNAVNSIKNNPVIPEDKKFELIMQEHYKHMALETSTREFVESGKYAGLPTEAEKAEAEKELKEAKEAELNIKEPSEEDAEEMIEEAGSAAEKGEAADVDGIAAGAERKLAEADKIKEAAVEAARQKIKNITDKRELTRMEAETTPEALKVKRARARAAYRESQIQSVSSKALDIRVE